MMQNESDKQHEQSTNAASRTWTDIEQLARRVIHAANLAVMAHAELDPFTDTSHSEGHSSKKAG
jgi:hypothetical protein